MSIEKLVQNLKSDEVQLIIDSMATLIKMINDQPRVQEEVIKYLPGKDIIRIMRCLEEPNAYLRKITARFFLELVYGNYVVQQVFCDILGIIPCDGKICLNKMPDGFRNLQKHLPECLEALRKVHPEELKGTTHVIVAKKLDEAPFVWFLGVQNAEQPEKKVEFFSSNEKNQLPMDSFVDPAYCMLGFVMRNPRVYPRANIQKNQRYLEYRAVTEASTRAESRKMTSGTTTKIASSTNSSLDHSVNSRILSEKSPQRTTISKYHSPMRTSIGKNPIFSSRYNNPNRFAKPTYFNSLNFNEYSSAGNPVATSICKTERMITNEFEQSKIGVAEDFAFKSIDGMDSIQKTLEDAKPIKSSHIKDKKSQHRDTDFSIDTYENLHHSKHIGSINESQEINNKFLETSLNNSISAKGNIPMRSNDRSPNVTHTEIKLGGGSNSSKQNSIKKETRKTEVVKKIAEKNIEKTIGAKTKSITNDKSLRLKDQSQLSGQYYPASAITTPKTNLLSKILKEKPFTKEALYSNRLKFQKENLTSLSINGKENFMNSTSMVKENITSTSIVTTPKGTLSAVSPVNNSQQIKKPSSVAAQVAKVLNPNLKAESEIIKKHSFHSSLMKSIDATERGPMIMHTEETLESVRESLNKENLHALNGARADYGKNKSYQISAAFKSPTSTPRVSELKSNLNNSYANKILSTRKSHDMTYLTRHKKKKSNELGIPSNIKLKTEVQIDDL